MRDRGWREPRGARSPPPVRLPRGFPSRCCRIGPVAPALSWNTGSAASSRDRHGARGNLRATAPGLRDRGRAPLPPSCPRQEERALSAPWLRFPAGLRSRSTVPRALGPRWAEALLEERGVSVPRAGGGRGGKDRRVAQRGQQRAGTCPVLPASSGTEPLPRKPPELLVPRGRALADKTHGSDF